MFQTFSCPKRTVFADAFQSPQRKPGIQNVETNSSQLKWQSIQNPSYFAYFILDPI